MGEQRPGEFDDLLRRVLQQDYSAGTEKFRDALLARCLDVLRASNNAADLSDGDLGLLAAAGDVRRKTCELRSNTISVGSA